MVRQIFVFVCFSTFFLKYVFVTKIHTWGTRGHAGLVHSTLHKSYKHEMNEHTGKRKVDKYPKTIIYRLEIIYMYGFEDIFVVENISLQKEKRKRKKGL